MNIPANKLNDINNFKKELRKFLNHIIKAKVKLQYIEVDLSISYMKNEELKLDIPLCKNYLINIRSKYKKEQNYFIKNMAESYDQLKKSGEITQTLFININYTKIKKRNVTQFIMKDEKP